MDSIIKRALGENGAQVAALLQRANKPPDLTKLETASELKYNLFYKMREMMTEAQAPDMMRSLFLHLLIDLDEADLLAYAKFFVKAADEVAEVLLECGDK